MEQYFKIAKDNGNQALSNPKKCPEITAAEQILTATSKGSAIYFETQYKK